MDVKIELSHLIKESEVDLNDIFCRFAPGVDCRSVSMNNNETSGENVILQDVTEKGIEALRNERALRGFTQIEKDQHTDVYMISNHDTTYITEAVTHKGTLSKVEPKTNSSKTEPVLDAMAQSM
tara:strand:+ start:98 stop:469 length:372 start_codon:yes stop_codon:yes gene_type:complete